MLAQRFTVARRATCGLPISATSSLKTATPFIGKRWKSAQAKETAKGKPAASESKPAGKHLSEEALERRYFKPSGGATIASFDGQRVNAGQIHLIPHKHEPEACVFVSEGESRYLDQQKGTLDNDGKRRRLTVPAFWLRDICQCAECVNPQTRQRTFNTFELERPRLISAKWDARGFIKDTPWVGGVMPEDYLPNDDKGLVLKVKWSDGHVGEYSKRFVRKMLDSTKMSNWGTAITWDNQIWNDPAERSVWGDEPITYDHVMKSKYHSGMFRLVDTIDKWGMALIENSPPTAEATQKLLEHIGPIRNTHYGGFYDFTADLEKKDTAYTNQALSPHTDTTYFTDPACLQAFHVLSHQAGKKSGPAKGGETILVDGIRAAVLLEKADPKAFETLTRVPIPWYSNGNRDACIEPDSRKPVISLHPESGEVACIRWNNDDRGVVPLESSVEWYNAAKKYHSLLTHPSMQIRMKLKPGTILITNNWRVLHGRTAFTGDRRVCGGYINRDDFESRWRLCKGTNDYNVAYLAFQDDAAVTSRQAAKFAQTYRSKWGYGTQS